MTNRSAMPNPVFENDTIYSRSEVLKKCESKSRKNVGIVFVRTVGFNQHGVEVISFRRTAVICRRGHGPQIAGRAPS